MREIKKYVDWKPTKYDAKEPIDAKSLQEIYAEMVEAFYNPKPRRWYMPYAWYKQMLELEKEKEDEGGCNG